jgi:hypothetical protein
MARQTTGYLQWYVNATAAVAKEAHVMMMRDPAFQCGTALYLYYKPNGLEFRIISEMQDSTGYELVTSERLPTHLTQEQLTHWVRRFTGSVPVLPAD